MDSKTDEDTARHAEFILETTAQYLRNSGLRHLSRDLTHVVQQNPIPALLCGLAVGFIVGRAGVSVRRHSHE